MKGTVVNGDRPAITEADAQHEELSREALLDVYRCMERFSSTLLRDYLGQIRAAIEDGQRAGLFRDDINATTTAKIFFGALDEMATNWVLSHRRKSLESEADAVVDVFLNGARAR